MQAAIALGVGMRLVSGVDDRSAAGRRRRHGFPDVIGALSDGKDRPASGLHDLAGTGEDLTRHEERDEYFGVTCRVVAPTREVVLVTAVAVTGRVGVVLEEVDGAANSFFAQTLLGRSGQPFEDPLPRLVVNDGVVDRIAFGCRVFGVRSHVEVETGAVLQEDVRRATPRDDLAKQVARDFVRAQPPLTTQRARDSVLIFEPEDPAVHTGTILLAPSVSGGRRVR